MTQLNDLPMWDRGVVKLQHEPHHIRPPLVQPTTAAIPSCRHAFQLKSRPTRDRTESLKTSGL